jgi:hypothetical protein
MKKCLNKMRTVATEGRTIVLVSHSMTAIESLCDVGIVISDGKTAAIGPIAQAVQYYLAQLENTDTETRKTRPGLKVLGARVNPGPGAQKFTADGQVVAEMDLFTERLLVDCSMNFVIEDVVGQVVMQSRTDFLQMRPTFDPGMHHVAVEIPRLSLRAGAYTIWFRLHTTTGEDRAAVDSERVKLDVDGPQVGGLLDVPCRWSWQRVGEPSSELVRGL